MSTDVIYNFFMAYAQNPYVLALLIILGTFILEDVAISVAALLSASAAISIETALCALIIGVIIGDFGLYGLGRWFNKSVWVQKLLKKEGAKYTEGVLRRRQIEMTVFSRFVPGMRLPTYVSMGLFSINFKVFFYTVLIAATFWTSFLFFLFFKIGEEAMDMVGKYQIISITAIILLAFILPYVIRYIVQSYKK